MATGANEGRFVQGTTLLKVFERTGQANATLTSQRIPAGKYRGAILWIKVANQVGGPSTWTLTLYHLRPQGADASSGSDRVAHATTLAQAGNGVARKQYGQWGASAALPELLGNEIGIEATAGGGGTVDLDVWLELIP